MYTGSVLDFWKIGACHMIMNDEIIFMYETLKTDQLNTTSASQI